MAGITQILEHPEIYRLFQSPFLAKKLRVLHVHNDLSRARRVLDVGCGPGMNTALFGRSEYTGIDINPLYIDYAKRNFPGKFIALDAREPMPELGPPYDFVLLNSFLHHIAADDARAILRRLRTHVSQAGHIHILDLIMPETPGLARLLAISDRGAYARGLEQWREIFEESFEPVLLETYSINLFGFRLWNMIYFKGKARRERSDTLPAVPSA